VLTYVAEITEPYLRGMLSATAPTTVIVGTVSQLVLGTFYHWRTVVLINMCFPIMALIALYFVPESPHWLISEYSIYTASSIAHRSCIICTRLYDENAEINSNFIGTSLKRDQHASHNTNPSRN